MITAKREIISEQDKYVSYSPRTRYGNHNVARPSEASHYREYDQADDFVSERYDEKYDEDIASNQYITARRSEPLENFRALSSPLKIEEDVLAPSKETMRVLSEPKNSVDSSRHIESHKKVKVNTRGKATIIGFAVVILSLIIVICLNAIAIASVAGSVANLENQLSETTDRLNAKNSELQNVSHPNVSNGNMPSGYVRPDSTVKVNVPGMGASTADAATPSNWFDKLCDFLSSVFGG